MAEPRCKAFNFPDGWCISNDVILWRGREYCRKHLAIFQEQFQKSKSSPGFPVGKVFSAPVLRIPGIL